MRFTVRDRPERGTLPPREDTAKQFVSLISRDERFEATGRVDEVRNVAFHQRDDDNDGEADGTLGALVDAGTGGALRRGHRRRLRRAGSRRHHRAVHRPRQGLDEDAHRRRGAAAALQRVRARERRRRRRPSRRRLSPDPLLAPCDRDDVLGRSSGQLAVTPLSIQYDASSEDEGQRADRVRGARQGRRGRPEDDPGDVQPLGERLLDDGRQGPLVAAHRRHRARHAEARRGAAGRRAQARAGLQGRPAHRPHRLRDAGAPRRLAVRGPAPEPPRDVPDRRAHRPAVGHLDVLRPRRPEGRHRL